MTRGTSLVDLMQDLLYLKPGEIPEDPVMRRMAACAQELRPFVDELAGRHGHGTTMAIMIAVVTNMALESENAADIAEALRQHAELIDARHHLAGGGGTA